VEASCYHGAGCCLFCRVSAPQGGYPGEPDPGTFSRSAPASSPLLESATFALRIRSLVTLSSVRCTNQ